MTNRRVAYKPGKKKGTWVRTRGKGGTCFTISFDRLARHLKRGGTLDAGQDVEFFEVSSDGITVFTTGGPRPATYPYLPLEEELG